MRSERTDAEVIYAMLRERRQIGSHRAVAYRCAARGCLLLDVLTTPAGLLLHVPDYKLSPSLNIDSSTAAGRAKSTRDGDRHWRGWTAMISDVDTPTLQCDHVHGVTVANAQIELDARARRGVVRMS